MAILSVQSWVAAGHVGNSAALFPLQRLGFETWAVPTWVGSNHPGHARWHGGAMPAAQVAGMLEALADCGLLGRCRAVLSGYVGDAAIGQATYAHDDPLALASPPLHQQAGHLGVVVEGVALDGVEDRLGQIVEIQPRRIADIFHGDLHGIVAPGRPGAAPGLPEELIDQRLIVLGLGGQAVDHDLQIAFALPGAHLAVVGPAIVHGSL